MDVMISDSQRTIAASHPWPFLDSSTSVTLAAERFISMPSGVLLEDIHEVNVVVEGRETVLEYGIDGRQYCQINSLEGQAAERVRRWKYEHDAIEGERAELWPIPETAGVQILTFRHRRALGDLVADTDTTMIDGQLIALDVAADLAASRGANDAEAIRRKFQFLYAICITDNNKARHIIPPQIVRGDFNEYPKNPFPATP